MTSKPNPLFNVGEIAILQPPHPSAKQYWGQETKILRRVWRKPNPTAFMASKSSGWLYETDIEAPPISDSPKYIPGSWLWCEYDLRKKYDAGDEFEKLMENLVNELVTQ